MAEKIIGVYKITNTVTGDFYIGSSKDVKKRWKQHKKSSVWKYYSNNPMYHDFKKYGVNKFEFQILTEVEAEHLKETEQKFIETLKPTYNDRNAEGRNAKRYKEYNKEYYQQNHKRRNEYQKEYYQQNRKKCKEYQKEYYQQNIEKYKEHHKEYYQQNRKKCNEYQNKYNNQLCIYKNEKLTLAALSTRFRRAGIENPTKEARKYLVL